MCESDFFYLFAVLYFTFERTFLTLRLHVIGCDDGLQILVCLCIECYFVSDASLSFHCLLIEGREIFVLSFFSPA